MKTYNYFYNGQPISKSQFLSVVPENWENDVDEFGHYSYGYYDVDEFGHYSYGYYSAEEIDNNESI